MANFTVKVFEEWSRSRNGGTVKESRPHVVPTNPAAVEWLKKYVNQTRKVGETVYGGLTDAISTVNYNGETQLAFRFIRLTPIEQETAVDIAEEYFAKHPL